MLSISWIHPGLKSTQCRKAEIGQRLNTRCNPSRARTSHRPYYAPLNHLAKLVHSRGDGLSSPCNLAKPCAPPGFPGKYVLHDLWVLSLTPCLPLCMIHVNTF